MNEERYKWLATISFILTGVGIISFFIAVATGNTGHFGAAFLAILVSFAGFLLNIKRKQWASLISLLVASVFFVALEVTNIAVVNLKQAALFAEDSNKSKATEKKESVKSENSEKSEINTSESYEIIYTRPRNATTHLPEAKYLGQTALLKNGVSFSVNSIKQIKKDLYAVNVTLTNNGREKPVEYSDINFNASPVKKLDAFIPATTPSFDRQLSAEKIVDKFDLVEFDSGQINKGDTKTADVVFIVPDGKPRYILFDLYERNEAALFDLKDADIFK